MFNLGDNLNAQKTLLVYPPSMLQVTTRASVISNTTYGPRWAFDRLPRFSAKTGGSLRFERLHTWRAIHIFKGDSENDGHKKTDKGRFQNHCQEPSATVQKKSSKSQGESFLFQKKSSVSTFLFSVQTASGENQFLLRQNVTSVSLPVDRVHYQIFIRFVVLSS